MNTLHSLMTQYCQLFGYSSCNNLSLIEKFLLIAVVVVVFMIVAGTVKRIITGVSK